MMPLNHSHSNSFFPATNPPASSSNERITEIACKRLRELGGYTSEFSLINCAIQQIPVDLNPSNVHEASENFNNALAGYSKIIDPLPIIACIQEVEELEQQLNECYQFLGILWAALPIPNKPLLETMKQIRKWFEDEKNQPLLDSITVLNLEDCKIAQISKELFKLRNLESLNISANDLTSLPSSIGQLKKLQELKVEANYLKELPKEIGQCTSLRILKVSENQIAKLPEELKYLTLLEQFHIADNELTLSPEDLGRLELYNWRQLQQVDLSENLLENVTMEFVKRLWPSATTINLSL